MKKMIKSFMTIIALVLIMSVVFAACDSGSGGGKTSGNSATSANDASAGTSVSSNADNSASGGSAGTSAQEGGVNPNKTVSKLEVEKEPDKTYYEVGETFTVEGGIVKVTYDDGTTDSIPMGSSSFTIAEPSMNAVGTKNINVKYGTKKCTFTVRVANKSFNITYNLNYDGAPASETVSVVRGKTAENKTPEREGYTFVKWYANKDYIYAYDFTKGVQEDAELFAFWQKNGATYVDVTFDHGYYGDLYQTYSYPVESGTAVGKPTDPVRFGYAFSKWIGEDGNEFDFTKTLTSDTKITATWTKTLTGKQIYTFEAEDTSLKGKVGPAFSGTCTEEAMIVTAPANRGCSNDRFVSYLYRSENSLEFYVACDEEVTDVTIYARLSAELRDYTFDPSNYAIELNDVALNYSPIAFVGVPKSEDEASFLDCLPFEDYTIAINVTLKKGANVIRLVTKNSVPMDGTTLEAAAPIVDAIKIETTGVVIWDANRGLPAKNY